MSGILGAVLGAMSAGRAAALQSTTYSNINASPTNCTAFVTVDGDGSVYRSSATGANGLPAVAAYEWLTGTGVAADYEVRVTETSGTVDTGTVGTWIDPSTDPSWTKSRTSDVPGTNTCTITIEIRDASTTFLLATASVTLTAEVT